MHAVPSEEPELAVAMWMQELHMLSVTEPALQSQLLLSIYLIVLVASVFCILFKGFFFHCMVIKVILYYKYFKNPWFYISVFKNFCCLFDETGTLHEAQVNLELAT